MRRRRLTAVTLLAVGLALPGCTGLCSRKEVVRVEEARRPVRFESPGVAENFAKAAKLDKAKAVGGDYTSVLFVTVYGREQYLAENAKFNDAVTRCDADQDGVITAKEVEALAKLDGN